MSDTDDNDFFYSCKTPCVPCDLSEDDDDFFFSSHAKDEVKRVSADSFEQPSYAELENMKIPFCPMTTGSISTQESYTVECMDLPSATSLPEKKRKEYSRRSIMNRPRKQPYAGLEVCWPRLLCLQNSSCPCARPPGLLRSF